jgi:hypothetical protein
VITLQVVVTDAGVEPEEHQPRFGTDAAEVANVRVGIVGQVDCAVAATDIAVVPTTKRRSGEVRVTWTPVRENVVPEVRNSLTCATCVHHVPLSVVQFNRRHHGAEHCSDE